jgi:hypothetical protein
MKNVWNISSNIGKNDVITSYILQILESFFFVYARRPWSVKKQHHGDGTRARQPDYGKRKHFPCAIRSSIFIGYYVFDLHSLWSAPWAPFRSKYSDYRKCGDDRFWKLMVGCGRFTPCRVVGLVFVLEDFSTTLFEVPVVE